MADGEHEQRPDAAPQTASRAAAPHTRGAQAAQRRRRTAATSDAAAIDLIGRIEVEIARIERAMDPPLV